MKEIIMQPVGWGIFYLILLGGIVFGLQYYFSFKRLGKKMLEKYKTESPFKETLKEFVRPMTNFTDYKGAYLIGTNSQGIYLDFKYTTPFFLSWRDIQYIKKFDEFYLLRVKTFPTLRIVIPQEVIAWNLEVPDNLLI